MRVVTRAERRRGLIVAVDVAGYGGRRITGTEDVQRRLVAAVDEVYRRAGVGAGTELGAAYLHARARSGDKVADLVCGGREDEIVAGVVLGLADVLRSDNGVRNAAGRMRVRVAVDQGVAGAEDLGLTGPDAVLACRLCDADVGRTLLAADPVTDVVALLSPAVYGTAVLDGAYGLWPEQFTEVAVPMKDSDVTTRATAWVTVPRRSVPTVPTVPARPRRTLPAGDALPAAGLVLPDGPLPPAGPFRGRHPGPDGQSGGGPSGT